MNKGESNNHVANNFANKIKGQAVRLKPKKKITMPQARAFCVHLLTASGSFLAFLSLVAASEKQWTVMFLWLGLALFVDGIDGPMARKLDVKHVLPNWSGELLDNVIDYVTYVLIPAFALYQSGFMGEGLSFLSGAIIVISSAIYYADTGMKTKENFFKGFPVVWNMVVFALFVINPGEIISFCIIVFSAILSFLPIYFVHPIRVVRLRTVNLSMFLIWCGLGVVALGLNLNAPSWLKMALVGVSFYIYFIGALLQIFPNFGGKNRIEPIDKN